MSGSIARRQRDRHRRRRRTPHICIHSSHACSNLGSLRNTQGESPPPHTLNDTNDNTHDNWTDNQVPVSWTPSQSYLSLADFGVRYHRIGAGLRELIVAKKRQGGYPTIKDVAQHAGVSKSLVSRALRGESAVRESTRQRILDAAAELGYRVHAGARSLAGLNTGTLGFVITGLFDAFWGEVMFAVDHEVGRRGMRTLYMSSPPDSSGEREVIDRMLEYRVNGLALGLLGQRDAQELEAYADIVPVLALMYDLRSDRYDTLVTDDESAMTLVIRLLTELGHSDIALIGDAELPNVAARARGYADEMERQGLGGHVSMEPSGFLQSDGYEAADKLLRRAKRPTAIACVNDALARGAVLAAADAGLDVPGDISITGYDDSLHAVAGLPRLTTVRLPAADIGQTAVSMLSDRMNGRDTALVSVLRPELVVRDSSGPVP